MQKLIGKTDHLIDKAHKLVEHGHKLRAQISKLESEVENLKLTLEDEVRKNSELNNKIKIIKLAQNISSDKADGNSETTELKRKINEYIREIDNCIALLND